MNKSLRCLISGALLLCAVSVPARAGLVDAGNGLINDTDQNLVWTQDANLFKTQYDADNTVVEQIITAVPTIDYIGGSHRVTVADFNTSTGTMTWWGAMSWAEWLSYAGFDDWRLTRVKDVGNDGCNYSLSGTDCGYNVDTALGELAYMHHEILGNQSWWNPDRSENTTGCPGNCVQNTSADGVSILNLESTDIFWTGTEDVDFAGFHAWAFAAWKGGQGTDGHTDNFYAWAVRDGQVARTPLPGTAVLMLLGLLGFGADRRLRETTWVMR